jgi:hypothetical protein
MSLDKNIKKTWIVNPNYIINNSMKITYVFCLICCIVFILCTQNIKAQEHNDESFIQFDFRLAPTSQGALEGLAEINLLWWDYLYSGVSFSVSNFTSVYDEYGGSTTTIDSHKVLNIKIMNTRDDLLKIEWEEEAYLCFNTGIAAVISWLNQEKYGHGDIQPVPGVFAYFSNQDIFSVKPQAYAELEICLNTITLQGYGMVSPISLFEYVEGEFFFSHVGSALKYSIDDTSLEVQCGGELLFTPWQELEIKVGFNYAWRSGTGAGVIIGLASVEKFPYDIDEYEILSSVCISVLGFKPVFVISYVYYNYRPQDTTAAISYSSDRLRFSVGMVTC